jgi:hypothetical protein
MPGQRSVGCEVCERPRQVVDCATALVIVEPYFRAAQEAFVQHEALHCGAKKPKLARVRLECSPWSKLHEESDFGTRNFAGTTLDGTVIVVAPEVVELPEDTVAAIMAHEFGHAYDFLYPGMFLMSDGELLRFDPIEVDPDNKWERQTAVARARQWRDRSDEEAEQVADAIAGEVLGHPVLYGGPCMLQCFSRGAKRPEGLR